MFLNNMFIFHSEKFIGFNYFLSDLGKLLMKTEFIVRTEFIGKESVSCISRTYCYKTKNTRFKGTSVLKIGQDLNGMCKQQFLLKKIFDHLFIVS